MVRHHHHFAITKLLLIIGILVGIFYAFYYIKEKYQAYQAYQTKRVYYQKVYKDEKVLKEKRKGKEKVKEDLSDEEVSELEGKKVEKEKNKQNKACSVYFDWEGCEKR